MREILMKILLIDDDSEVREMIAVMLSETDAKFFEAADGDEGIKILRDKPDINVVITDIIMPEKEGLETIREIKKDFSHIKILAISGGGKISADNYLQMAKGFGADEILEKPFVKKELLDLLDSL